MPESIVELDSESRPELRTISFPHKGSMGFIAVITMLLCILLPPIPYLLPPIILAGSCGVFYFFSIAQKKRDESKSLDFPHEVYPPLLKWKKGDKIRVDDPYESEGDFYSPNVVSGYFQGVLDDYSLLISDCANLDESKNTYRVSANTLRIVDSASFSTGVRNETLADRRKKKQKDNAKELLESSDYDEMLKEIKSEFANEKLTA